ncbi:innexin shaking-B [Schistocerca cancellata]|uniref:innexin shaking-B n=1 Tax=Schistocerca cancellata TaxID=274614 RepID=UPI0021191620|nr:innexin shaking-B [Schistocerca cancellata]
MSRRRRRRRRRRQPGEDACRAGGGRQVEPCRELAEAGRRGTKSNLAWCVYREGERDSWLLGCAARRRGGAGAGPALSTASRLGPDDNMLDIFRGLKSFVKISHIHIDSPVFRLHYSITVMILVAFSLIVTTRQYVGNPIDCIHTKDIPEDVLNTFCWIHSTYTIKSAFHKKVGVDVPHKGIDNSRGSQEDRKSYMYYQWVCFCLFFQAILFYTPRWLWKNWEGGKIHALIMDLDVGICSEVEKKQKKKLLLDYLWDNLRYHNWWAYRYYLCELLSLVNVVGQMFLMNRFFDGAFLTFGIDVLTFMESDQEDRWDPMIYIFPRMTKCTFHKYGVSGEIEKLDAVCILPLNVVNEKIYVFLWFWFLLLAFLTTLSLLFRVLIIMSPRIRVYLLRFRFRMVRRDAVDAIVVRSRMGDWFLLYMLGQNVDCLIFRDVMHELADRLKRSPVMLPDA